MWIDDTLFLLSSLDLEGILTRCSSVSMTL